MSSKIILLQVMNKKNRSSHSQKEERNKGREKGKREEVLTKNYFLFINFYNLWKLLPIQFKFQHEISFIGKF